MSIEGTGFAVDLAGSDQSGTPLPLGDSGALRVPATGAVQIQGDGFARDALIDVFLDPSITQPGIAMRVLSVLDQPTLYLGSITTDSEGRWESEIALPAGVPVGDRVLQLTGQTTEGDDVVLSIGITVEPEMSASIMITGTRGEGRDARRIYVNGITTGLVGQRVFPSVKLPGQTSYSRGIARRTVGDDGTFTWRRISGKKTYVYFSTDSGVRSKSITIKPKSRR